MNDGFPKSLDYLHSSLLTKKIGTQKMRLVQSLQCLQYFFYAFAMLLQYFYNTLTFTIFDVVYTLYFEAIWNNVVLLKAISKTLLMNSLSVH